MAVPSGGTGIDVVTLGDVAAADVAPDLDRLRSLVPGPAPGFVAGSWLSVASGRGRLLGFARAVPTPHPFPAGHVRGEAVRELGVDRRDEWLAGGLELVELVVDPTARGEGVGRVLQAAVRTPARRRRCWLVAGPDPAAAAFLRRCGWVAYGSGDAGSAVFLSPEHPAVRAGRPAPRLCGQPLIDRWPAWTPSR